MAAFDVSNRIMTLLAECGAHAVIGNWVRARSIGVRNGIDFQSSGIVERLQSDILENVLSDGLIPIFPNIGWSAKGKPYNISSNELSLTLSTALKAAKLFFLTNRQELRTGDFSVPKNAVVDKHGLISQLTVADAAEMIELNKNKKGNELFDLITMGHQACSNGVRRVHIVDGSAEGMVLKEIFSNRGLGTMVYTNQYENIRPITPADIPEVLRMMQPVMEDAILVPRGADDLKENLDDYYVYEVDGTIHGCGALHVFDDRQGEIAALVVDEIYANLGIGKRIISYLIEQAYSLKLKAIFALTTQTSDWFLQLGFTEATVDDLPVQRQESYDTKRNSLIFRQNLKRRRLPRPVSVE
jgi:amino-acid N-acetyltransferase